MKFSTKEDVEAPIEAVFDMLCDFKSFERAAMRRGAEVQRADALHQPGVGMTWKAVFPLRGKRRELTLEMVTFDRPNEMVIDSMSQGLAGQMSFELMPLSRNSTRVLVALEVKPLTLSARLWVQSLKLAKTTLTQKYKDRVAEYARGMEERYASGVKV